MHGHSLDTLHFFSAFLLGLSGGFAHCTFMCGGFVVALHQWSHSGPLSPKVAWSLYQGGRVLTYTLMALGLALLGQGTGEFLSVAGRSPWLFVIALLLLGQALSLIWPGRLPLGRFWSPLALRIGQGLRRGQTGSAIGLVMAGLAWGLLPCGLSWSVILAASTLEIWKVPAVIFSFGVGTVVALTVAQGAAAQISSRFPRFWKGLAVALLLLYAFWNLARFFNG